MFPTDYFSGGLGAAAGGGGYSVGENPEVKAMKQNARERVDQALSQIGVRDIMHLRDQIEVSAALERVAVSVAYLVSCVPNEGGEIQPPIPSWDGAKALMMQTGNFINSMRKFPYTVEQVGVPPAMVEEAKGFMMGVEAEHLNDTQEGLKLFQWFFSAVHYFETVTATAQDLAQGAGTFDAALPPEEADQYGPRMDQYAPLAQGSYQNPYDEPAPAVRQGPGYAQPTRSQQGRPAELGGSPQPRAGRQAKPKSSPMNRSSPATPTVPVAGGPTASLRRSQERAARAGGTPQGSASRLTNSTPSTPLGSGQLSSFNKPKPRLQAAPAPGGYPQGPRSKMGVEDFRRELDRLKRESREMKGRESETKWAMHRQEKTQRKTEKQADQIEIQDWRQQQAADSKALEAEQKQQRRIDDLEGSRDHADFKKEVKKIEKDEELAMNEDNYLETKAYSEAVIEDMRTKPKEERAERLKENLEKYEWLVSYHLDCQEEDKRSDRFDRDQRDEIEMQWELQKAETEREAAREHYEFIMEGKEHKAVEGRHMPASSAA